MKKTNKVEVKVAKTDREFVGIKIINDQAIITFPIGYNIKEEIIAVTETQKIRKLYEDVKILMTTIEEAKEELYETGYKKFSFSSAIFILEDYLKNGLYDVQEKQCKKKAKGKIIWKKTIQEREPIYSAGNYIYLDTYHYNICEIESKIAQIQKYCLNISSGILGWLYNCSSIYDDHKCFSKEEMIYELLNELNQVNEDRKKKVIEQMILFLNGTQTSLDGKEEFQVGSRYFNKVWENILRKQTYGLYKQKSCFPTTYYVIEKKIMNSKLLPDITIQKDKKIVIIDAKYYRQGELPASSDICKQLFYGQYIMYENPNDRVINIFMLPKKITQVESTEGFFQIGYANAEYLSEKHKILTYYLDTKSVMQNHKIIKKILLKHV